MHAYRSHSCADLTAANVGETVRLSGWVNRVRDHGGILFIDLRDHYGITQVLCDPDSAAFAEVAKKVQMETVELMMAAGKEASEEASAAVKKATAEVTTAAKKAASAK